ncbi:MAG: Spo0E family sporulation regulatory protein-aspartic acid phosphatase [Maledivibacter sp.]|jgi:hypothetical protein|nr:Spo0E family sporulation regulatory protein-aspartic acid phosphatase [Maledivibacter sp.]
MENMSRLRDLIFEIDDTKRNLYKLIQEKQWNLLDSEVIKLSQLLDELLLQYHNVRKK